MMRCGWTAVDDALAAAVPAAANDTASPTDADSANNRACFITCLSFGPSLLRVYPHGPRACLTTLVMADHERND